MKSLLFITIVLFACSSSRKAVSNAGDPTAKDSLEIPVCIKSMIDGYRSEDKQNPPRKIYSYQYHGQTVYYVTAPCCDFFSDLYDSSCVILGHPDGGFTGKGDGKLPDFKEAKSNEILIWKDDR